MSRTNRIALVAAAALLLVATGGVLANRAPVPRDTPAAPAASHQPQTEPEADAPPTGEEIAHAEDRLEASGVAVDDGVLAGLAARYGLGGAVRLLAWSSATAVAVDDIAAMRDGTDTEPGMGWGRIARELGVHPGIGSIMGSGHGRDGAPGQLKQKAGE